MDQARLIIAIALSFLVFLLWELLMVDREPVQQPTQAPPTGTDAAERREMWPDAIPDQGEPRPRESAVYDPAGKERRAPLMPVSTREITVDTPRYILRLAERGASLTSFLLKDYREAIDADAPLLQMVDPAIANGTLQIDFGGKSIPGLSDAPFTADRGSDSIAVGSEVEAVAFSWVSPENIRVEKTFYFEPDSYLVGLDVTVDNGSQRAIEDRLLVSLRKVFGERGGAYGFSGPSALTVDEKGRPELEQIRIDAGGCFLTSMFSSHIKDKNILDSRIKWMAVVDRYFISSVIPEPSGTARMQLFLEEGGILDSQYVEPVSLIPPGTQKTFKYQMVWGPKDIAMLKAVGYDLDEAVDFGWFDFLAKPCVWLMNLLYGMIPNYGIAIIMLTVLTKVLLWPLGTISYRSMAEMKKIQPLMAEIREKYKEDKRKMNEEVMGLYRTYKINPLGGCLPMLVQLPVFFALYRMLYEAIELRHAPFFGWINDLSAPDRLFDFNSAIPFMADPDGIPVLTIVMGATMFLSQKMSPPMGDPTQAKMMMLMPIFFTFIFINFSSGLVLYWLVNNVLSIAQQYYTTKKLT